VTNQWYQEIALQKYRGLFERIFEEREIFLGKVESILAFIYSKNL
jgi:hypothetical protein